MELTGRVFGIQRFSIHDGNGIRTNVFLMGCPLRCIWCHNPEGISKDALLSFSASRCTGCGACFVLCPEVHSMENDVHIVNRKKCRRCFKCVQVCTGQALEQSGSEMTVSEVMDVIKGDKRYYDVSGGGATLSGGEPMIQITFTTAILKACKTADIDTALETCGLAQTEKFEQILPLVDTFLFDIKESNPALHLKYTGADNELVLKNLEYLSEHNANIVLRCPIIPGINDRTDHFKYLARLSRSYTGIGGVEIMPYHKLGVSKTERMGITTQEVYNVPSEDDAKSWEKMIEASGGKVVKN